jgi:uncharacterized cupredoxin-like copper-binding protein
LTIIASAGRDPETGKYRQKRQTVKRRGGESEKQLRDRAERDLRRLLIQLEEGQPVESGRLAVVVAAAASLVLTVLNATDNVSAQGKRGALELTADDTSWNVDTLTASAG